MTSMMFAVWMTRRIGTNDYNRLQSVVYEASNMRVQCGKTPVCSGLMNRRGPQTCMTEQQMKLPLMRWSV